MNITSYHLLISQTELVDDDEYECQIGATDSTPALQSHKAKLTVQCNYIHHSYLLTYIHSELFAYLVDVLVLVLCDTGNWNHFNDAVSDIAIMDITAIPELHMKRQSKIAIPHTQPATKYSHTCMYAHV